MNTSKVRSKPQTVLGSMASRFISTMIVSGVVTMK